MLNVIHFKALHSKHSDKYSMEFGRLRELQVCTYSTERRRQQLSLMLSTVTLV